MAKNLMAKYAWHFAEDGMGDNFIGLVSKDLGEAIEEARDAYHDRFKPLYNDSGMDISWHRIWVGEIVRDTDLGTPRAIDLVEMSQDQVHNEDWLADVCEADLDSLQEKFNDVWKNWIISHHLDGEFYKMVNLKEYPV